MFGYNALIRNYTPEVYYGLVKRSYTDFHLISYRGAGITAESPCFIRIIPHLRRLLWHKLMGITITPETQRSSRLSSANA